MMCSCKKAGLHPLVCGVQRQTEAYRTTRTHDAMTAFHSLHFEFEAEGSGHGQARSASPSSIPC
jgi:hypothetical protein